MLAQLQPPQGRSVLEEGLAGAVQGVGRVGSALLHPLG